MVYKCWLSVLLLEGKHVIKRHLYSGPFTLREVAFLPSCTNGKDSLPVHSCTECRPMVLPSRVKPRPLKTICCNLLKISPPSKIHPPRFFKNEVVAKGAFLLKVHPPMYAAVHAVMLKAGSTEEGRHAPLLLLCKHHNKRESLHAQIGLD